MGYMKYVKQLAVIMAVSFVGELLNALLPFPVPGSVYGLILMFFCLMTGIIKLSQVEETGDFLIKIMPVMFIGPLVSLMTVLGGLADKLIQIVVLCMVTTLLVMAVTGWVVQAILNRKGKGGDSHE